MTDRGELKRVLRILAALWLASIVAFEARASETVHRPTASGNEIIYFVLPDRFENGDGANDRGGLEGDRLVHGFDPAHKGFYHGGDLKGLTSRLDYIKGLGASAVWLGPIYKNKPVQGAPGEESAGYHGYWITDFTAVDPHFGTDEDLKAFVDAAHARGMKVYLDIITNHTADVIRYAECDGAPDDEPPACAYRARADYPYTRSTAGGAINPGFLGDGEPFQTAENFSRLTRTDYAYTPYIPKGEEAAKKPAWLNDVRLYHNRGDSHWSGESALYGDFASLDDLMTENPAVVEGFIEIYKDWITRFRVDGFRVDTAKHVGDAFWRRFVPAVVDHARAIGIPHFFVFGEVYEPDPAGLARFTRDAAMPAVLDFGFQSTVEAVVARGEPAIRFEKFFASDALYEGGAEAATRLPTFVGNHDMGRFSTFVRNANPDATDTELLKKTELAHAMMFFLRGAPVIYYGDEQGFIGDGNDQDAREDMFASQVAIYNDNDLIGATATTAGANFDQDAPLYRAIARMAALRNASPALQLGRTAVRLAEKDGGVLAVSRLVADGPEYLIVFNAGPEDRVVNIDVDPRSTRWTSDFGACPKKSAAVGVARVAAPAYGYVVCRSNSWKSP